MIVLINLWPQKAINTITMQNIDDIYQRGNVHIEYNMLFFANITYWGRGEVMLIFGNLFAISMVGRHNEDMHVSGCVR